MRSQDFATPRAARALGAGLALLFLTAACSAEGTKSFACKGSSGIDGLFGVEPSAEHREDCTGMPGKSGEAAARTGQAPGAAVAATTPAADNAGGRAANGAANGATVKELQRRLGDLGYDAGPDDGMMGPKTRSAIRAYQSDNGLAADGRVSDELIESVRADSRS